MKTLLVCLAAAALLVPAVTFAGVGNGTCTAPPGLANARERILAGIERQIQKEDEKYAAKAARIQAEIDLALLIGDLGRAAELQEKLQKETERHEQRIARLQARYTRMDLKFQQKIADYLAKHPCDEEEEPPPEG